MGRAWAALPTHFGDEHAEDGWGPLRTTMEGRCGARARLLEAAATAQGTSPATLAGKAMQFLAPLDVVPFDDEAAAHFARVKASLAAAGSLLGPMDLLIAATVRARGAVLVTNNLREFSRVPGLRIENWMV